MMPVQPTATALAQAKRRQHLSSLALAREFHGADSWLCNTRFTHADGQARGDVALDVGWKCDQAAGGV
jgi:hypothetical protein